MTLKEIIQGIREAQKEAMGKFSEKCPPNEDVGLFLIKKDSEAFGYLMGNISFYLDKLEELGE